MDNQKPKIKLKHCQKLTGGWGSGLNLYLYNHYCVRWAATFVLIAFLCRTLDIKIDGQRVFPLLFSTMELRSK